MAEIVDIGEVLAEQGGDCRVWTPLAALKSAIADIEAGKIEPDLLFVAMRNRDGANFLYPFYAAGGSDLEIMGFLARHLMQLERVAFENGQSG